MTGLPIYNNKLTTKVIQCSVPSLVCWLILACRVWGQSGPPPADDDNQFWGGVQVGVPLREKVDVVLIGSVRQGRDFSHPVQEQGGAALMFRVGEFMSVSPVYQFLATQPYAFIHGHENRLSLNVSFSHRWERATISNINLIEERWRLSRTSNRYRNRLQFEWPLNLGDFQFRAFIADEVFYDWSVRAWNRNRFFAGVSRHLNSALTLDIFYAKQNGKDSLPRDLNVIGATFRVKLKSPFHHFQE